MFKKGELETLVEQVGGLKVTSGYYDRDNWCVECEKE